MQENISVTDSYSTGNAAQAMLEKLLQIYDVKTLVAQLNGVGENHWSAAILKRALANDSAWHRLSEKEFAHLQTLLPKPPAHHPHYAFRFIDLFAGIGGIRRGFESIGGQCVFTSEWNKHAVRTYKANHYCDPATHHFNEDIRDITLSHKEGVSDEAAAEHIRQHIPEHDVLLAGFPCQPFSLAGVSKKNSLGRAHGFACDTQGTLFFDVVRIIDAPVRLIVPWKYGFKGIKSIVSIKLTRERPPTTWNLAAPDEYGFYANVNPYVDHPRWSQATERFIGSGGILDVQRQPTLLFNGYADQVASLYRGLDLRENF